MGGGCGVGPKTFNCTYTHTWCDARDIFSCTCTHTSCYARDIFSCTHTHIFTTVVFSCTYTHTSCYAREVFSCTYTRRKKCRVLKKFCPVKPNGMLQWVFKILGVFKVQFQHDYGAVAPSTFDSKTWTTAASAIVTPPGCLCLLGFTETIPTSFKKLFRFALPNSNKTGDLIMHPQKHARTSTSPTRYKFPIKSLQNLYKTPIKSL